MTGNGTTKFVATAAISAAACAYLAVRAVRRRRGSSSSSLATPDDLEGELVVITGAAGGLGRELALAFGRRGAYLALWDAPGREEALARAVSYLERRGGVPSQRIVSARAVDVSDPKAVERAFGSDLLLRRRSPDDGDHTYDDDECDSYDDGEVTGRKRMAAARWAIPRVVVSNAAVMRGATILDATDEELRRDFETNALGPFWVCRAFLRRAMAMVEDEGGSNVDSGGGESFGGATTNKDTTTTTIVFIGSIMAEMSAAHQSEYCASKAAVSKLHECLRWELKKHNKNSSQRSSGASYAKRMRRVFDVRSLLVLPYAIDTPMISGSALVASPGARFSLLRRVFPPLQPSAVAERVVDAVLRGEERVYLPRIVGWISAILYLLPTFASDALLRIGGAEDGMDGFVGCAPSRR